MVTAGTTSTKPCGPPSSWRHWRASITLLTGKPHILSKREMSLVLKRLASYGPSRSSDATHVSFGCDALREFRITSVQNFRHQHKAFPRRFRGTDVRRACYGTH